MSTDADPRDCPRIGRGFRLQWEAAQDSWVLLYPEGMVKLNTPAAEILKRCSGEASVDEIIASLEAAFGTSGLRADVESFLAIARAQRWVEAGPA